MVDVVGVWRRVTLSSILDVIAVVIVVVIISSLWSRSFVFISGNYGESKYKQFLINNTFLVSIERNFYVNILSKS